MSILGSNSAYCHTLMMQLIYPIIMNAKINEEKLLGLLYFKNYLKKQFEGKEFAYKNRVISKDLLMHLHSSVEYLGESESEYENTEMNELMKGFSNLTFIILQTPEFKMRYSESIFTLNTLFNTDIESNSTKNLSVIANKLREFYERIKENHTHPLFAALFEQTALTIEVFNSLRERIGVLTLRINSITAPILTIILSQWWELPKLKNIIKPLLWSIQIEENEK